MAVSFVPQKPVRNSSFFPDLRREGTFTKPLPEPEDYQSQPVWYGNLKPYERMFYHQTLNSARRYAFFMPSEMIPKDALDFAMQARYNHSLDRFGERVDALMQKETAGEETFRRTKNTKDQKPLKVEKLGHPLRTGGTTEKISPYSVKLINSGHHTQMTNPGYSRQPADGNVFNY